MNKIRDSYFWKIYIGLTAAALLLMFAFFAFFYDYMKAYELSQPIKCAENYVSTLSDAEWKEMFLAWEGNSQNIYESKDMVANAYWQAVQSMPGTYTIIRDYSGATTEEVSFFVQKDDKTIARLILKSEMNGKYGFDTWNVAQICADLTNISVTAHTYTITVPAQSAVYVNGVLLNDSLITNPNAPYPFAHALEKSRSGLCETYTVTALYATPEIECVWMGVKCVADFENDNFRFRYPDTAYKSYTVTAPASADVLVNGVPVSDVYVIGEPKAYPYSRWESGKEGLPQEITYSLENLLTVPNVTATVKGIAAEVVVSDTEIHISYPQELLYTESFTVPSGSIVTVNGQTLGKTELVSQTIGYPELYGNDENSPKMDVYILENLYMTSTDVQIHLNGIQLPVTIDQIDREVYCTADYPNIENEEIQAVALAFCKDYFAYTSGGYKDTEENLQRVLVYLASDSELYRRIKKSQESIGFVTPVTSHKYHELSIAQLHKIDDSHVMCVVRYEVEQWTYRTQRMYSGNLWLALDSIEDNWVITGMLMDTK